MPVTVSGSGHTGKQIKAFDAVIRMRETSHKVPTSVSQQFYFLDGSRPRWLLTEHLAALLRARCKQMSARSVKNPVYSVPTS